VGHGDGGMAKQPLNDLYLRTRTFAPAEMATEAHVWRRAVEYPAVLTQRQMPALTTREQEARPSGVPRRVRAPVHDVTVWSRCPFPRFLVLRRMLPRRGR
jgi:hypothetical protein